MAASLPPIKGFLETSFIDWPGLMAAVLFLPGCNFKCPYCHNHQLVNEPESLLTLPWPEVAARLTQFEGWLDGVVVSGGEPTLHHGLPVLLRELKKLGFKTKLDTNGSRPNVLAELLKQNLLDMIAMDWKAPLEELAYCRAAGVAVDLRAIEQSRQLILNSGLQYQFRSTVWPAWHGMDEIKRMAQEVGSSHFVLQAMQRDNLSATGLKSLGQGRPYSPQEIKELAACCHTSLVRAQP